MEEPKKGLDLEDIAIYMKEEDVGGRRRKEEENK